MQKNLIIVECLSNYDWLNLKLLPHLRNEFDSRLLLIRGRQENSTAYQKLLLNDDEICYLDNLESDIDINNNEILKSIQKIREFEDHYKLSFFRDILQQSRQHFSLYVPYLVESRIGFKTYEDSIMQAATYISLAERIFQNNSVRFLYVRPGGIFSTILIKIAVHSNIPVTFVRPSRYKSLFNWTLGGYSKGQQIAKKMQSIKKQEVSSFTISHDVSDVRAKLKKYAKSIHPSAITRDFALILLNSFLHNLRALRNFQLYNGMSLFSQLSLFVAEKTTFYWLCRNASSGLLDENFKYFVFLLPVEPEYTVNSLGRSVSDVRNLIWTIALSLPVDCKLIIKEHAKVGYRDRRFYKDLLKMPNIVLADIRVPGSDLIKSVFGVFW